MTNPAYVAGTLLCISLASPLYAAAAQANLLPNGDAEQGEVGQLPPHWVRFGYDGVQHPSEFPFETTASGRNGSKGMRFEKPKDCQWTYVQQYVPLQPGVSGRAVFRVWLRAAEPIPKVGLHLYMTPAGQNEGGYNARSRIDVTTDWERHEIGLDTGLFISGEDKGKYNLRPIVQLHSGTAIELDDASLTIETSHLTPAIIAAIRGNDIDLGPDAVTVQAPIGITGGIVQRPDGTLVAVTSDFGIRRSRDGGRTWTGREALDIDDKVNHITGAIQMRNGTIGIWTESWNTTMYFWKSADGGRTWSDRITIGPKGAPLHGNVMIEMAVDDTGKPPQGWRKGALSKDGKHNQVDSASRLVKIREGASGIRAAALELDAGDEWIYAQKWVQPEAPLKAGDEFVFSARARAGDAAKFDLYIEAWNPKTSAGTRTRERFTASADWAVREITLSVNEAAAGLSGFRIIVQLYTPGVELQFDDVRVERVVAAAEEAAPALFSDSFEQSPAGTLVIPVREGHSVHGGLWENAKAGGTICGKWVTTEGHAHAMEMDITFVYYSTDAGDTWRRSEGDVIIWKDDGYGGMWPADEPNVAQLKDGRLIMLMRTTLGRLYQAFSSDGGRRWDYPQPTALPSSYSPCCLERIPANEHTLRNGRAGDLVCVWNNVSHQEITRGFRRGRLSCAVSRDDGKTWSHIKTIATAGLPAVKGIAALSEPQMMRADKDLGELPMPFGIVDYPDITFADDRVLIKYYKRFRKPDFGMGTPMYILPIAWLYED